MKVPAAVTRAARTALDKKAAEVVVLDLRKQAAFTDFFVLASAANQKQLLAVADAVQETMRDQGLRPKHVEGYPRQEWIVSTTPASSALFTHACGCSTISSGCGAGPSAGGHRLARRAGEGDDGGAVSAAMREAGGGGPLAEVLNPVLVQAKAARQGPARALAALQRPRRDARW